jgi:hypothetical protein
VLVVACAGAQSPASPAGTDAPPSVAPALVSAREGQSQPAGAETPPELVLRAALPVDASEEDFQPSGLLLDHGRLLTVSDKHDRAIYELELGAHVARATPFVVFDLPAGEAEPLDFEGLSRTDDGVWLLASESTSRVLEVQLDVASDPASGAARQGRARWSGVPLFDAAHTAGCLVVPNAGFEGIVALRGGGVLLAAEREPRALLAYGPFGAPAAAAGSAPSIWLMQTSIYPTVGGRNLDFSDLTRSGEHVYALARSSHLLVRLMHTSGAWREAAAFSYLASEDDPRYRYESRKWGLAEGVAIGSDEVFVIMDNNGKTREQDAADRRPLLFVFERPPGL